MTIQPEEIRKIAYLARLAMDDAQLAAVQRDVGNILKLVDQLQSVDVNHIAPLAHPQDALQRLRADTVIEPDQRAAFQAIAPATENGLYLVPKVIE